MPSEVWDEITYPFPNFNGCTVEVWEQISNFYPYFMVDVITHPCLKLVHINKRGPNAPYTSHSLTNYVCLFWKFRRKLTVSLRNSTLLCWAVMWLWISRSLKIFPVIWWQFVELRAWCSKLSYPSKPTATDRLIYPKQQKLSDGSAGVFVVFFAFHTK